MNNIRREKVFLIGIFLVAVGVFFNKWLIEGIASPDQHIESYQALTFIVGIQIIAIGFVAIVLGKRPDFVHK